MNALDTFQAYFDAFEDTYADDDWARIEPFFAEEMTYLNAEGSLLTGRAAAISYLQQDVNALDRRFDSRAFDGTPDIRAQGDEVTMVFTVRYKKAGVDDLVLSGREVATIRDSQIQHMEDQFDSSTIENFQAWIAQHGALLAGETNSG